jgi:hypothetical protein
MGILTKCPGYVVEFATKLYEAVFKPLKPLISKELAVFLLHGRVFSQGVFRGCSRFYEHGVFRVFRGVFTIRGVHPLCSCQLIIFPRE